MMIVYSFDASANHKIFILVGFLFVCFVVNVISSAFYLPEIPVMAPFLFSRTNINLLLFFCFHLILREKLGKHMDSVSDLGLLFLFFTSLDVKCREVS